MHISIRYKTIPFPVICLFVLLVFSRCIPTPRQAEHPPDQEPGSLVTGQPTTHGLQPSTSSSQPETSIPQPATNSLQLATHNPAAREAGDPGTIITERPEIQSPDNNLNLEPAMKISKEMLLGRLDPAGSDDFALIDSRYTNRVGMYMQKEAYDAFLEMHTAAEAEGISLIIISAMRTFNHQKRIWENKWNGRQILSGDILATTINDPVERALEILRFSAMPGTSRHHWGTDIDLNSLNNSYFETGEGRLVYEWLLTNAASYGFCQPYTAPGDGRSGGHEEERWHWSFKPVASECLKQYAAKITYDDIGGFDGWQVARQIDIIGNFMMTVNEECR